MLHELVQRHLRSAPILDRSKEGCDSGSTSLDVATGMPASDSEAQSSHFPVVCSPLMHTRGSRTWEAAGFQKLIMTAEGSEEPSLKRHRPLSLVEQEMSPLMARPSGANTQQVRTVKLDDMYLWDWAKGTTLESISDKMAMYSSRIQSVCSFVEKVDLTHILLAIHCASTSIPCQTVYTTLPELHAGRKILT
jgi:hypothetical protein